MTRGMLDRIRKELLRPCGREHKLYAELGKTGEGFVVRSLQVPGDADYIERTPTYVHIGPAWMMRTLRSYADSDAVGILEVHSHPFCERAIFSGTDDHYIGGVREDFERKKPGGAFLRMVTGQAEDGFTIEAFDAATGRFVTVPEICVVGDNGIEHVRSRPESDEPWWFPRTVYSRVASVRTPDEHRRLSEARGVVIGAGGTGFLASELLACLGVGDLTIVDADVIEPLNMNRLVGTTRDELDRAVPKAVALARILRDQDSARGVRTLIERFPSHESVDAIANADYVVCCVDDPVARLDVLRTCARHLVPALDVGSSIYLDESGSRERERHGHAWLYVPGGACWLHMGLREQGLESPSLREARQAMGYVVGDQRESPGSVQTLNATVVAQGLTLLEAYLAGRHPVHNVVLYEERVAPSLTAKLRQFRVTGEPTCPLCGDEGIVGAGGDPFVHGVDSMTPIEPPSCSISSF